MYSASLHAIIVAHGISLQEYGSKNKGVECANL